MVTQGKKILTTEQSEVIPFLRAVRAKKRGREATPQGGRRPPVRGREATVCWGVTLRSPVFYGEVALNIIIFR